MSKVPFTFPAVLSEDVKYATEAINNGQIAGDGPFTKKAQLLLEEQIGNDSKVLLTTSCTHALEMAAILLNICPGDEVIVPSYTFVSTALAFYMHGAKIVFSDIRADTLNIDESQLESLITERTRAIVVVHYGGVSCEMNEIVKISEKYNLDLIEDNSHGLYGKYRNQNLGSIGHMATQSFHQTKNISCGEGGALILNNSELFDRAEIIREKGTNRSRFYKGQVDKYTWVDKGSSYVMSDILAAILYSQLLAADDIQQKRRNIWQTYNIELSGWARNHGIKLPQIADYCSQPYHVFYLLFPETTLRNKFIEYLADNDICATVHYQPLHSSDFGRKLVLSSNDICPVTTNISNCIVRLPLFYCMTEEQLAYVVETIYKFQC